MSIVIYHLSISNLLKLFFYCSCLCWLGDSFFRSCLQRSLGHCWKSWFKDPICSQAVSSKITKRSRSKFTKLLKHTAQQILNHAHAMKVSKLVPKRFANVCVHNYASNPFFHIFDRYNPFSSLVLEEIGCGKTSYMD